jgi:hypothetical protein
LQSSRSPSRGAARASRLGVAIPVLDTHTTPSIWSARSPARSSAALAASTNKVSAASRYTALRDSQRWSPAYHSTGATVARSAIPALS